MGVCILEDNFEGKGWSSRLLPILLILTWKSRYPQKWGVNRKRGGSFGSCSALEGSNDLPWGRKEFTWGTRSRGKQYKLTIKWTSSKTVVKDFPYTFRVPSVITSSLLHHTKMNISEGLAFLWITLQWHET